MTLHICHFSYIALCMRRICVYDLPPAPCTDLALTLHTAWGGVGQTAVGDDFVHGTEGRSGVGGRYGWNTVVRLTCRMLHGWQVEEQNATYMTG